MPHLMNRSLNCQNPKMRPCCCVPSCTRLPAWALRLLEGAVRCLPPSPGPGRSVTSSNIHVSPGQHFRLGRKPGCPQWSMLVVWFFYEQICISTHVRHLQPFQKHWCEAGPSSWVLENTCIINAPLPPTPGQVFFGRTFPRKRNRLCPAVVVLQVSTTGVGFLIAFLVGSVSLLKINSCDC